MSPQNLEIIKHHLKGVGIIKDKEKGHRITIKSFETHYSNGTRFMHKDGNNYGIVIFNALTDISEKKIIDFINNNPKLTSTQYVEFIDSLLLTKYIYSNSDEYETWDDGDLGILYLKWNNDKRCFVTKNFVNATALERGTKIREKIEIQKSDKEYHSENYNTSLDRENAYNSDYYNDQLDMDQQSPEFWDSL